MLGRLLHPLNQREQTLLLCLLSFGGEQSDELLGLLPDDVAEKMGEKRDKLAEIPKEKRVPLMVRQLKQLMGFRGQVGLDGVEPSWLLAGFKGESPRTVAIVLMHMPSSVSRQITARLPDQIRNAMPSRTDLQGVPMELIKLVRSRFDAKFAAMPTERVHESVAFRDVLLLNAKELILLIRKLGLDELAVAFIAMGKRALAAFLSKLPADNADELMSAVKRAASQDRMDQKAAQAFLGKILRNFSNTDELFQKAGLFRLARAVRSEDAVFVRQLQQRFPRAHGRLLADYLRRVRLREEAEAEQTAALRDSILDMVLDLSRRGKIDSRYQKAPALYEAR